MTSPCFGKPDQSLTYDDNIRNTFIVIHIYQEKFINLLFVAILYDIASIIITGTDLAFQNREKSLLPPAKTGRSETDA